MRNKLQLSLAFYVIYFLAATSSSSSSSFTYQHASEFITERAAQILLDTRARIWLCIHSFVSHMLSSSSSSRARAHTYALMCCCARARPIFIIAQDVFLCSCAFLCYNSFARAHHLKHIPKPRNFLLAFQKL